MKGLFAAGVCVLLSLGGAAHAEFTVTPAVVSDYDARGISQSALGPALQLGVDYSHLSGFHSGVFASTLDVGAGDPKLEVDLSAGYAWGDDQKGPSYDAGVVHYVYTGASDTNFEEAFVGIKQDWFSAQVFYAWNYAGADLGSAYYLTATGTFGLAHDFALVVHAGYSAGEFWDATNHGGYVDWLLGITRKLGPVNVALSFIDGSGLPDADNAGCSGRTCDYLSTDSKLVLSLSTQLLWGRD
jgi:uncharacterized protein (TIGR02001 family)